MVKATINDLLKRRLPKMVKDKKYHHLYVVRDNEVIFYVGRSLNVPQRLRHHLAHSILGDFIKVNLPASKNYQIEILSPEEAMEVSADQIANFSDSLYLDMAINHAEIELIDRYNPIFNNYHNINGSKLPDKYKNPMHQVREPISIYRKERLYRPPRLED